MFLIGLDRDPETGAAHMAVLKKELKGLKRHYRLMETAHWPSETPDDALEAALCSRYNDRRWTVRRKVFSQDRRPAKNVRTPPLLAARFRETDAGRPDTHFIDALRARKLPVEGISITHGDRWRREDYSQLCLGNNYFVPAPDLSAVLRTLFSQGRLSIDPACAMAGVLAAGPPPSFPSPPSDPNCDPPENGLWRAAALPVWFSETVRKIARYGDA